MTLTEVQVQDFVRNGFVRLDGFGTEPFRLAATAPALHEAFDQRVGHGAWIPRTGLGTLPLRFPGPGPAKEAGWHLEASFAGPNGWLGGYLGAVRRNGAINARTASVEPQSSSNIAISARCWRSCR